MIILQAQDLTKRFNGENIFSKVNLAIQEKSRVALVGRNGAGKSTLVKMIIGEQSIDGGQIVTKKISQLVTWHRIPVWTPIRRFMQKWNPSLPA